MKIKYVGNRPVVSIMCSGRVNYIFYKDNDFVQDINDPQHAAQILRSVQHKFETIMTDTLKKKALAPEPVLSHPAIADDPVDHTPVELPKPKKGKTVKQLNVTGGM